MTNKLKRNVSHVTATAKTESNLWQLGDTVIFDKDSIGWHITQINEKMGLYNPASRSLINDAELFDLAY